MPRRLLIASLGVLAGLAMLLVIAQLVLPGVAANRLRDRLNRHGQVQRVSVGAFPALKLLWGDADSVSVRMERLAADRAGTGDLLARARHTDSLDVRIATVQEGPLLLHDVVVGKSGAQLSAQAALFGSDLHSALPPGFSVAPAASGHGQLLLRAIAGIGGLGIGINAVIGARDGALVIQPALPLGSLATLTLFADPRVAVQSVGARADAAGWTLTGQARLTGA